MSLKKTSTYEKIVNSQKTSLIKKYNASSLNFPEFDLQYKTYFYFKNTSIFDNYQYKDGFPIALKGSDEVPLIPLYFGLVYLNTEFKKENFDINLLKSIAQNALNTAAERPDCLELAHHFDYPLFGLKAPWISGITQSIASSFFVRLYVLTKEKKYLNDAVKFFNLCIKSKVDNGCLVVTNSGLEWVEEYKSKPSAFVLSGHIFAIIAASELYQLTSNESYKFYTENWLRSLISELSSYQFEKYIIHNKYQWKLSNIEYQGLYVGQFKHLYELTGNDVFLELYNYYNKSINWNNFYSFYGIKK